MYPTGKHRHTKSDSGFAFVHIKADLLLSLIRTIQRVHPRKYSQYEVNTGIKIHILHILLYHHISKWTNTLLTPFLPFSLCLSPTDPVSSEQCVRRGGKGKREKHMPISSGFYHTQNMEPDQTKQKPFVSDKMKCTVLFCFFKTGFRGSCFHLYKIAATSNNTSNYIYK